MPEFRPSTDIQVDERGDRWSLTTLADSRHVPGMPMAARRWRLEAGGRSPHQPNATTEERFLYVIAGTGKVHVGSDAFSVEREDVVWLEPHDAYSLEAASEPLEVLEAISG
jgi:quercetin dioxygenase-like cupin family protein